MKKFVLLLPLVFFFVNLATIADYNVNWDAPVHFMRGQAYLRYLLTRKTTYDEWPGFRQFRKSLFDKSVRFDNRPRYSIYQSEALDGSYFLNNDGGHPPINGILAAATNTIVYQKLGLLGDVNAYNFFILIVSSALVFLVTFWSTEIAGWFAGLVSFLTISLYPMFIAESHNNIKDPVEAAFFAWTLYLLYRAVRGNNAKFMFGSAVLAGMALGTKFNILFAPFIVLPWLVAVFVPSLVRRTLKIRLTRTMALALVSFPFIAFAIFYFSWPYLWADPWARTIQVITYYREIGTGGAGQQGFNLWSFNTYPILWIFFTTPPAVILLVVAGILAAVFRSGGDRLKTPLLWVFWFAVPILRVSLPGTSIYGGARQIMEYVPALALLSGIGADKIIALLKETAKKQLSGRTIQRGTRVLRMLVIVSFLPIAIKMIQIHPNEGLYFNAFIGGLPGAVKRNLPGWGTTLGNPYLQAAKWLNQNAEPNAKVALALGVMTNIPFNTFRPDVTYLNNIKSVHWREGEYVIGLTYSEFPVPFYDALYYERFLNPIYEIKVEGVPIVKIWKNEARYVKPGFLDETEVAPEAELTVQDGLAQASLQKTVYLTKLVYSFVPKNCQIDEDGVISVSLDGKNWVREPETLLTDQIPQVKKKITEGMVTHFMAAVPAKFVKITPTQKDSCMLRRPQLRLFMLRDIMP